MRSKSRVRIADLKVTPEGVALRVTVGRSSERITLTKDRAKVESAH
jgi:hypothetical protein